MKARSEKPLLLGYYSARQGIPARRLINVREKLTAFAEVEGYALAGMFDEPSNDPSVGLQALLESAARRDVVAVAVPSIKDLGTDQRVRTATVKRLHDAGFRVLVLVGGT